MLDFEVVRQSLPEFAAGLWMSLKLLALCLDPPEPGTRTELCSVGRFCIYADTCLAPEARTKVAGDTV